MTSKYKRVAVASKEGLALSEHFGHAKRFLIYEQQGFEYRFTEERQVDHYCHGHTGDQSAMQRTLATLQDCDLVLVAKIGDGPRAKLNKLGVEAVARFAWERIDDALVQLLSSTVRELAE